MLYFYFHKCEAMVLLSFRLSSDQTNYEGLHFVMMVFWKAQHSLKAFQFVQFANYFILLLLMQ